MCTTFANKVYTMRGRTALLLTVILWLVFTLAKDYTNNVGFYALSSLCFIATIGIVESWRIAVYEQRAARRQERKDSHV